MNSTLKTINYGKYELTTVGYLLETLSCYVLAYRKKFPNFDFSLDVADQSLDEINEYMKSNDITLEGYRWDTSGWYGACKLNTGFEDYSFLNICSDYYGGGCLCAKTIDLEYDTEEEIRETIFEMLKETLSNECVINKDMNIFIEWKKIIS